MFAYNKKTVLITGASNGIGYEMSKVFAERGFDLVLIGRNEDKLLNLSKYIVKVFKVNVKTIGKDLSKVGSALEIFNEVSHDNIKIDILVNNAGVGYCGLCHEIDLHKQIEIIKVNIEALTCLTWLFSREMVKRKSGKILNVASTGAYEPGPYTAVYYAAKAYVLSFSQAIRNELGKYGVVVSVLCPGSTRTKFSVRAGKSDIKNSMSPRKVAQIAYNGLEKNRYIIIPGLLNKIIVLFSKLSPGFISAKFVEKIQKSVIERFSHNKQ